MFNCTLYLLDCLIIRVPGTLERYWYLQAIQQMSDSYYITNDITDV